jgi:CBS domain-containing protein
MYDQLVREVMKKRTLLKASIETLVVDAAKSMAKKNVGAVLVMEGHRLVGILTERDVVFRVVAEGLDPGTTRLREVMTPSPQVIAPSKPFGVALSMMHKGGFGHLPVVEDDKVAGIVSARSAMDPDLAEFVSEDRRREYYAR